MEEKEVMLTSVEQLNEYLNKTADERSVISIVLDLTEKENKDIGDSEGGEAHG